ncbi:hypothetical protein AVEN_213947-1 [Araneus ventricosus]|uniref:Uncharacterized protein n=1 Tax=Araneus ventricosus TaxID=182803 RepID=A0A4Y2RN11_ARAVE|nr:hypothetical protein AVEN_184027-1 [Araneus ventricosus]GBN77197.1 hypothetical protein AVEN_213947-1 [Araneus ventricosus]
MLSQKSVTYRSAMTVQVIQPDTGQRFSKRMKDTVKPHQTVIRRECSGLVRYSRGFDFAQIRLFCEMRSPCSEKWASSIHMMVSNHCESRSICASAHVAKFCLSSKSGGNNW